MVDAATPRYSDSCVAMSNASLRLRPPIRDVSTLGAGDGAQPLLILTCVDGALRDSAIGSCAAATETIRALASRGVAVVLTSYHSVDELLALEKEVGVMLPFIAANGRSLHIPRGYFGRPPLAATRRIGTWDVIEFAPPSLEDALDVLLQVGANDRGAPLLVGVGASWPDHLLLRHVDIPVVVRSAIVDQHALRVCFPHAYVTDAVGAQGWSEAILGSI
jgi:predicted mannosyl-3-phosphoglycerate phosphatase (HAD superfamily)